METGMDELSFSTANNAVRHLGRKLYSTVPPALAELVANAYDGYAEHCCMFYDSNKYVVADDGIGMSLEQLRDQYTSIGQQKKEIQIPDGQKYRPPMGKKGIGKLAAFSLGDEYSVYTKTAKDATWAHFSLSYPDMLLPENQAGYKVRVDYLTDIPDLYKQYGITDTIKNHGFVVVIKQLRKLPSKNSINYLQKQLSRRFYLRSSDIKFDIEINGDSVNLSGDYLYEKTVCANYVGYKEEDIKQQFGTRYSDDNFIMFSPTKKTAISQDELDDLVQKHGVRGWVGAMSKPRTQNNLELGSIVVYINGKIADEDFLKNKNDSQIGNQYIIGELFADYLNEEDEEPITSSRQGLDESDEQVEELLRLSSSMRSKAIGQWNALKERNAKNELPKLIKENVKYNEWYDRLPQEKKKFHNKLLKTFNVDRDFQDASNNEEVASLMNSFIMMTQGAETRRLGRQLQNSTASSSDLFRLIGTYFGEIASVEKLQQAEVIAERLSAIKTLQEIMSDPSTREKVFRDHLLANPWLLNPYWSRSTRTESQIKVTKEHFEKLYNERDEKYKKRYIDIYVEAAGEDYPIVVELKKNEPTGHAHVSEKELESQILDYRIAIVQGLDSERANSIGTDFARIPAYAIISEDSGLPGQGNRLEFSEYDMNQLESANIKVLTYRDIVNKAMTEYQNFMDIHEQYSDIPYFSIISGEYN